MNAGSFTVRLMIRLQRLSRLNRIGALGGEVVALALNVDYAGGVLSLALHLRSRGDRRAAQRVVPVRRTRVVSLKWRVFSRPRSAAES
jgi:hypothetical protein